MSVAKFQRAVIVVNVILGFSALLLISSANADNFEREWLYKEDKTLSDLYKAGASIEDVLGLSLPSGRQVIVTYVTIPGSKGSELYRCIEFLNDDMRIETNKCYKLD
jgi:hypothetical protein